MFKTQSQVTRYKLIALEGRTVTQTHRGLLKKSKYPEWDIAKVLTDSQTGFEPAYRYPYGSFLESYLTPGPDNVKKNSWKYEEEKTREVLLKEKLITIFSYSCCQRKKNENNKQRPETRKT